MEAVINPWWFYWLEVSGSVKSISEIVAMVLACVLGVLIFVIIMAKADDNITNSEVTRAIKYSKIIYIPLIMSALISIFTPSSDTLIKMAVAQNVTVDRVAVAQDVAAKVYNDIIGLIKENK